MKSLVFPDCTSYIAFIRNFRLCLGPFQRYLLHRSVVLETTDLSGSDKRVLIAQEYNRTHWLVGWRQAAGGAARRGVMVNLCEAKRQVRLTWPTSRLRNFSCVRIFLRMAGDSRPPTYTCASARPLLIGLPALNFLFMLNAFATYKRY